MATGEDPIARELAPDEQIIWRESPPPRALTRSRIYVILGLLIFFTPSAAVAIGSALAAVRRQWTMAAIEEESGLILALGISSLFAILLGYVLVLAIRELFEKTGPHYALTNRRLIVVARNSVTSHGPNAFAELSNNEETNERGTISFTSGPLYGWEDDPTYSDELLGVAKPAEIERLIRQTFRLKHES